ncbi:hypothetical protein BKA66DRAFT_546298 [Pyrenochaeta sp. MPI-SDFR-AT-0127]|nr:hypothetical protein BKA66DRAFT_546298 [Pyrenochaeta sp. MPI-SDFR-AT-0127]
MNSSHSPAIIGVWRDYPSGEHLLSIKNPWGIIIVALAGIWLSWSTKYVKKILGNIALWVHLHLHERPRKSDSRQDPNVITPLLEHDRRSVVANNAQPLAKVLKEKSGIRDLFADCFISKELSKGDKLRLLIFTMFVAVFGSGIILGGYFWTKIRVDGPARLASDKCGLWLFEGEKRSEAATRARLIDLEKEERAAQFAEDCYRRSGSVASRCHIFSQPSLPISDAKYTNDCPFQNEICRQNQTVTFTSRDIKATDIGINSPSGPKFRRSTACTPLSMDYPYIQNKTENNVTTFTYHYGPKYGDGGRVNYTYSTVGNPWDRLAPVYDVFAYSSNVDDSDDPVWEPHPHLTHPKYSTVTIIFISSLRILYDEHSDDPIFPADEEWDLHGDRKPWFRNSDPRARPLACINTIEVCTGDGSTCWNLYEPTNNATAIDDTPEFILLYSALFKTDIYYSLAKRQGRALLAQKKVSQYFSTALGSDPWVAEVENWVKISLARTSINAWSVASGEDSVHAGKDGFIEKTKGYGELCGRYKYNPPGYQSLHFVPLMLVVACLPLTWFLSWDWKPIERTTKKAFRPVHDLIVKRRAEVARPYRNGGNSTTATREATPDTSDPALTTTIPRQTTSERESATPAEAGESTTTGAREHQHVESQNERDTTAQDSTAEDSETSDGELVKWEPLVWHMLLYALWNFLYLLLLLVLQIFWVFPKFIRERCSTRNRTGPRGAGVTV